jgi:hypothetical protein
LAHIEFRFFLKYMETVMKAIKLLCLLSVAVFPLAPASVEMSSPAEFAPTTEVNMCGRCGDGQCVKSCGETATSCPADCGVSY